MSEVIIVDPDDGIIIKLDGSQGPPGAQGPPGLDGLGATTNYTAGATLSGQRAVVFSNATTVVYANNTTLSHRNLYAGVTTSAVTSGATVAVQRLGKMTESSWNWTSNNPVFFSTNGTLTQTVPTGSFIQIIGVAISSTSIFESTNDANELA